MELSEIQHIAKAAEKAFAAAGNYPRNAYLREDLFDLLGPLTKLTQVDDATYSAHLNGLFRQTGGHCAPSYRKLTKRHCG